MSLVICTKCHLLCDCDEHPEGYYDPETGEARDDYICPNCMEDFA